jgi:hypothetical protein
MITFALAKMLAGNLLDAVFYDVSRFLCGSPVINSARPATQGGCGRPWRFPGEQPSQRRGRRGVGSLEIRLLASVHRGGSYYRFVAGDLGELSSRLQH